MDYVGWVGQVLEDIVEENRTSLQARNIGVSVDDIARVLHGPNASDTQTIKLKLLFAEMADAGLLTKTKSKVYYKLSDGGRSLVKDPTSH